MTKARSSATASKLMNAPRKPAFEQSRQGQLSIPLDHDMLYADRIFFELDVELAAYGLGLLEQLLYTIGGPNFAVLACARSRSSG